MGGTWSSAEMSAVGERVTELRQIVGELAKSQAQAAIIDARAGRAPRDVSPSASTRSSPN
jgi:hypothetical protein